MGSSASIGRQLFPGRNASVKTAEKRGLVVRQNVTLGGTGPTVARATGSASALGGNCSGPGTALAHPVRYLATLNRCTVIS